MQDQRDEFLSLGTQVKLDYLRHPFVESVHSTANFISLKDYGESVRNKLVIPNIQYLAFGKYLSRLWVTGRVYAVASMRYCAQLQCACVGPLQSCTAPSLFSVYAIVDL